MAEKKTGTAVPGVRYREHETRVQKNGRPDRYYFVRFQQNGVRHEEGLGWASEGWTVEKAQVVLVRLKEGARTGEGPRTLTELRILNAEIREAERSIAESITLAEVFDKYYLPTVQKRKRTWSHDRGRFDKVIRPELGLYPLAGITTEHIEALLAKLRKAGSSEATALQYMAILRQLFNMARITLVDGASLYPLPQSPMDAVRLPKAHIERERFLTQQEALRLIEACTTRSVDLGQLVRLALNTGLRFGELMRLQWEDVSLHSNTVSVRAEDMRKPGGKVPLNPQAKAVLEERSQSRQKGERRIFPESVAGKDGYSLRHAFERVVEEAGLNKESTSARDRVVFHTLRHTFASWLAMSGRADIYRIKTLMRHRTIKMTERYAHLLPDATRDAVNHLWTSDSVDALDTFNAEGTHNP